MFVVGLTGGIGSGKTTIGRHFETLGIELIDADVLAREVVAPGSAALTAIGEHFGQQFITAEGSLDRPRLREAVFADTQQRDWLEALLHPLIADLMQRRISGCGSAYCLLVSPLLLETGQRQLVHRVLVVDVSEETQLRRTLARDTQSDEATIRSIIAAQTTRENRLQLADDVIDNELSPDAVRLSVDALHSHYLELAREHESTQAS